MGYLTSESASALGLAPFSRGSGDGIIHQYAPLAYICIKDDISLIVIAVFILVFQKTVTSGKYEPKVVEVIKGG